MNVSAQLVDHILHILHLSAYRHSVSQLVNARLTEATASSMQETAEMIFEKQTPWCSVHH